MASPLLDRCPPTLPGGAYRDPGWLSEELRLIWRREWVCAGRLEDFPARSVRRVDLGGAPVIVVNDGEAVRAFHNLCRHRGAEMCGEDRPLGRLITCPYHAWSYAPDGRLVSTAFGTPTADFDRGAHGLLPVATKAWNGLLFLSGDPEARFEPDLGVAALDNWPMADLRQGHRLERVVRCNWKVFWENYSECLHCPGVHPGLSALVPVYREGVMAEAERRPGREALPPLREGARTWTPDGQPCGPEFPDLSPEERGAGAVFVTLWPSAFVVAHPDHARLVRLRPLSPTETLLTADWLFPPEALAQPGFDAGRVAAFAAQVLEEDALACEGNQRGIDSPAWEGGRLMPQEYEVARFHDWVRDRLQGATP